MKAGFPSVAQVREAPPGELAVLLSEIDAEEVRGWGAEAVEAYLVATQVVASWASASQVVAVNRFVELVADDLELHVEALAAEHTGADGVVDLRGVPVGVPDPAVVAAGSLAPLLNLSPRTVRTRVERARLLEGLPATFALASAGVLEPWRVDAVLAAAGAVGWEALVEFEARLYAIDVSGLPRPRLAERARAAAVKADPEGAAGARAGAPRQRGLRVQPCPEVPGLMRWTVDLPDQRSRVLLAAVDALGGEYLAADDAARAAARSAGEPVPGKRSVAAARVDALADLALSNATVHTAVELVVTPQSAQPATVVTRPQMEDAIARVLAGSRTSDSPGGSRGGSRGGGSRGGGSPAETSGSQRGAGGVDVLVPADPILLDLVTGRTTRDTLAAGELEAELGSRLGEHLKIVLNPFLTTSPPPPRHCPPPPVPRDNPPPPRDRPPAQAPASTVDGEPVWFVDGITQTPGTGGLLPADVVRILTDPDTTFRVTGGPVGSTDGTPDRRRTYRPRKALAQKIRARDRHCRFPGCSVPAPRCHLDHVIRYPDGPTTEDNLCALCPTHHAFKHHAGWTLTMTPYGTCIWTAPTGRQHTTEPTTRHDTAA
ncbi:MAG: HNH endonuclease [Dermatophilaceae bacterium]